MWWWRGLYNSVKLWVMPCRANQDRQVIEESSEKCGPVKEGMANHFDILALRTPWTAWKGKKIWSQKMSPKVRRCPINYWEQRRAITNSSRKNEVAGPKWKECSVWMCLVVRGKYHVVKKNIAQEPGMLGSWVSVNWTWSSRWHDWTLIS